MIRLWTIGFFLSAFAVRTLAAGHLLVEQAWIRTAPPGVMMLAGYATLRNDGDSELVVVGADSTGFGAVSVHQTIEENGVERMRPLARLSIAPGATVKLSPGGKHLMLMRPKLDLKQGDAVRIHVSTASGDGASGEFLVRDDPPDH